MFAFKFEVRTKKIKFSQGSMATLFISLDEVGKFYHQNRSSIVVAMIEKFWRVFMPHSAAYTTKHDQSII